MTGALLVQLLGGAGFLAGVAVLLNFLNTRKSTRTKGGAEAYQAYREFVHGAFEDVDDRYDRVKDERDQALMSRGLLIDLVLAMIQTLRTSGVRSGVINAYQDRLDDIRRR